MWKQSDIGKLNPEPLVSIIVPVYNVQTELLQRCIQSIEEQPYQNIELIIVDDGSDTETACACDKLAGQYKNAQVIHSANKGVSSARNIGIKLSHGKYVSFIDADDWIDANFYEKLLALAEQKDLDIVVSGYKVRKNDEVIFQYQEQNSLFMNASESLDQMLKQRAFNWILMDKVFRRQMLVASNVWFDEHICMGEDLLFCWEAFSVSHKVEFTPLYAYNYFIRTDSATHIPNPKRKITALTAIEQIRRTYSLTSFQQDTLEQLYIKEMASCCVTMMLYGDDTYRDRIIKYQRYIKRYGHKLLLCKHYSAKIKLGTLFLYFPYAICRFILFWISKVRP